MSNTTKIILSVAGALVLGAGIVGLLILEDASYEVLWEDVADGTVGLEPGSPVETQTFEVPLTAGQQERFLEIKPRPESGWGYPNFDIAVSLEDPAGSVVVALPDDHLFRAEDYDSEYDTRLKFTVPQDGTYTLSVIPRSVHLDSVRLEITEKK